MISSDVPMCLYVQETYFMFYDMFHDLMVTELVTGQLSI